MRGDVQASPLVGTGPLEGAVLFASSGVGLSSALHCLDAETGKARWMHPLRGIYPSSPLALYGEDGGAWIVQGDEDGLHLLDMDGKTLETLALGAPVAGSPAAFEDMIVVATRDGGGARGAGRGVGEDRYPSSTRRM